ncbi:hypothetical protein [Cohnella soli]|uniref:Glycosyl hydrolase-like 10 domain-containing protein n=1 Tax=Cohnella soli TaxID=425005 RepID=A0ABW0I103_9BACL
MKIHYPLQAEVVLDPERGEWLSTMKRAGVDKIWLHGYFYGHMASSLAQLCMAKEVLERFDFEVGVINVPLGHPGNALNPDDPDLELALPPSWRCRIDRHGDPVYYCADIEDRMVADSVAAVTAIRDAGFADIFMDDDMRQGNWDREIQGCFCESCVEAFNRTWQRNETRESLSGRIENREISEVLREWMSFQSNKVTSLMTAMAVPGVRLGFMTMPDGDERHGIDITAIQSNLPDCMFRVGEHLYNDRDFGTASSKALELNSILKHLNRVGRENSYSETTCFPYRALSAANLVYKAKLAISAGIPNLMLMSGTYVYEDDYWQAWGDHVRELREMEEALSLYERVYPVHVAYGTHGLYQEPLHSTTLPTLSGLPVKPVRGCEKDAGGEVLLVFGDYTLDEDWEQVLPVYKRVILDARAFAANSDKVSHQKYSNIQVWDHSVGTGDAGAEIRDLRALLALTEWNFPMLTEGTNIALFWLPACSGVILLNLEETSGFCRLAYRGRKHEVTLPPMSCKWIPLLET